ncbi:hypothetical protein DFH09DRAFT_1372444 [Mycena vulgaris]|nr:hypothetical protein DFH09DRAFT_1372444 [Mycena vulgaris]
MDLTQELIDAIVDAIVVDAELIQDPWIIDNSPATVETLRSCALVGRAFVHPCQMHLFHGLTLSDKRRGATKTLSTLLVTHPHLASDVRGLSVDYREVEKHLKPITHVLALVKNLTHLAIYPDPQRYPGSVPASVLEAFTFPKHLHHIALGYFHFENVCELHALLCKNTSLTSLVLRSITFETTHKLKPGDSQLSLPRQPTAEILSVDAQGRTKYLAQEPNTPLDTATIVAASDYFSLTASYQDATATDIGGLECKMVAENFVCVGEGISSATTIAATDVASFVLDVVPTLPTVSSAPPKNTATGSAPTSNPTSSAPTTTPTGGALPKTSASIFGALLSLLLASQLV